MTDPLDSPAMVEVRTLVREERIKRLFGDPAEPGFGLLEIVRLARVSMAHEIDALEIAEHQRTQGTCLR